MEIKHRLGLEVEKVRRCNVRFASLVWHFRLGMLRRSVRTQV